MPDSHPRRVAILPLHAPKTKVGLKLRWRGPKFKMLILTMILFSCDLQVNEYQAKIKDTTRKMMALVSELSMNQASAMKLQQEVRGKEQQLEQCYVRMERGEAPSEEAEREWNRMVRDEERRNKELMEKKEVCRKVLN